VSVDKEMVIAHRVKKISGVILVKSNAQMDAKQSAINTLDIVRTVKTDIGETCVTNAAISNVQHVINKLGIALLVASTTGERSVTNCAILDAHQMFVGRMMGYVLGVDTGIGAITVINNALRCVVVHATNTQQSV